MSLCGVLHDRAAFFWAKMTKNGQKWPRNNIFQLFKDSILMLVFVKTTLK